MKGKVDYVCNLCDEGFNNDPRKELHVPALLEMLGIPYTGAGPQSLAFCYDKSLVRGVAKEMGIPVPDACFITPGDRTYDARIKLPAPRQTQHRRLLVWYHTKERRLHPRRPR